MNSKSNAILNFNAYRGYCSNVHKDFVIADISTLKVYDKRQKKYILIFFIKFFIYILLIWILQCFNNWYSSRSGNYKNNLKIILCLGAKGSLIEGNNTISEVNEGLEHCEQMVKGENFKLDNKINKVENSSYVKLENKKNHTKVEEVNKIDITDVELGKEIKANEKNKKGISPKNFLIFKDKYETIAAYFIIFLIFCILVLLIITLSTTHLDLHNWVILLFYILSLTLAILLFYEIKKKEQQKKYYRWLLKFVIK
ncbi:fam-h protein [Plasmodium relictum]|uniref:Fam-h protein n=1 Tax=Plasmodium relictum TaxID=85471 RepID=A0A1J1GKS1_PLARL|nr:fam-h protein [Plasmodium relictum]CRG85583.1 fam-h protein [Plasmodium relictum]